MNQESVKQQRIAALGCFCCALAAFAKLYQRSVADGLEYGVFEVLLSATAVVFLFLTAVLVRSSLARHRDVVSMNWFLPALVKRKDANVNSGVILPILHDSLPASFVSDRTTKRRGLIRRFLRQLGPSWLASPVRRFSQFICMGLFLLLFFWVCWPYDIEPKGEGQSSGSWVTREVSDDARIVSLHNELMPEWVHVGLKVFVVEEVADEARLPAIAGHVLNSNNKTVKLQVDGALTIEQFEQLVVAQNTWRLSEHDPYAWPAHYAENLAGKEVVPAELFLSIDPLVSLSTAIASRSWVWSLAAMGAILIVCVAIPRGFCGYVCPLGTLIDLFDWSIGRRVVRFRVSEDGWWVHIKYYLLAAVLIAAVGGVLISGFVAAIPVVTRGMLFVVDPMPNGMLRGFHLLPHVNWGHLVSVSLFLVVLCLGFLRPRFWCKYVCPSGATFSLANLFRATERKVESSCIHCNKCVEVCPFDAIKPDFTTRVSDCTLCQTCGGVCPTHAIKFVQRGNKVDLKIADEPPTHETVLGRRGFMSLAVGSTAAIAGGGAVVALKNSSENHSQASLPIVRPPGSVPEDEFLQMCIRCGECFKACPNNVLQPQGFEQGFNGLWAPKVNANWAGCESSCNACGQVCPTGAIRALPMEEKRVVRMGLAVVNDTACLPIAGKEACQLCVDECNAAGYRAIEFQQVHTLVDDNGEPIAGSGFLAPVVLSDKCVGCGLCQTRCYAINVKERALWKDSAIIVHAGEGKEDRLMSGSYRELRSIEGDRNRRASNTIQPESKSIPADDNELDTDDPFGLEN